MGNNLLGYKGIKPVLFWLTVLTLVQSISIIFLAKWLAEVISALFAGEPLQEQAGTTMLFLLAFVVRQAAALLQQKVAYRFAEKTGADVRKRLMEKLFQLGPRFSKSEGTGNLVTLVLEGVSQFRTYLELFLPRMISTAITPIMVVAFVFMQDMVAGIILVLTMPILIAFLILVGLAARKQMDRQWESYRILSNHFVDSLRGLETLKFLGRSRAHSGTIDRVSDQYRSATLRTLRVAFLSSFALDFFTMMSVASVAVSLGLRLVEGNMTLVTGLTILILAPEYFLPVRMVGADYHATLNGKEAGKAIDSILAHDAMSATPSDLPPVLTWTEESTLTLSGIQVRHDEEGPSSLEDVTLTVTGMQKIGIIGESGAGKSTLIDVLAGFLPPSAGQFELNGKSVQALTDEAWRKETTYIPQHPYLFSSSLADNVRFYAPEASKEEVEQALSAAGLSGLAASLPQGCDEMIGNGGRALSGGQEQRVALARAFLCDRPIVLLDEPTAHLDIETEYELKETMLSLFKHKLVFLATHRMHWMPDMDLIIVLDHGRVAETGTHEQLLARRGVYYDMMASQREGVH
ncbi:thiol reductant ABC exporter subunit CydD [Paenibacillus apiarius]|uniref:Thiol reductant ABC exporter subunit CydD n=1 Tax=Paenibacillus apiarius TaxID=46240 RepID=A0ABT4DRS7_9BACL|nr:thiol reductant ABC exporter subunit CydD [Paenibacillus apiarius]MCY9513948.1 thiol reductant ABC exporter subunit CydD [Paenibacillus apiarius]MCY9519465.1 thiol reductant ABC exporter subunit CydD [Paenibacillus apiarius]MCY9552392.1 thiol reductant ABC exporter subunit CydD [Paenibacillus apiarius]MCY9556220.1 thiol reductant ABC exporter subunit CydD [Paenibacillus apiarius]MCY9681755.1 thiol reductant ABC exporter subunit CydD [Paenibacillus apiarius]